MSENNINDKVLVRMPPSPTGWLHLGTARTALFNWLFAKAHNGEIIFRWEDTDQERSKEEFEIEILDGLKWLGMDFRNGIKFYRQTECLDHHKEVLQELWAAEKIFPCFSTKEEIQAERDKAAESKTGFVFWSPWRDFSRDEAEARMKTTEFVWRLRTPKNQWIKFKDKIRKKIEVNSNTIGDIAVARADGSVLYMLANVIDDHTQGVTHVIRGEDHISNTPKQVLLYQAWGKPVPTFAHIPLVLDSNKKKLSKRNVEPGVCVLIRDFRAQGFLPEAVVNGLALTGWNPKSTDEIFSLADLEVKFNLAGVNPAAAQYDFEKMKWFNAQWIRRIAIDQLQGYYRDFTGEEVDQKLLAVAREKARNLVELQDELTYLVSDPGFDPARFVQEKWGLDRSHGLRVLKEVFAMLSQINESEFTPDNIKQKSIEKIAEMELKNGPFLWPFRVALSNRSGSAGPFQICAAIGKEESLKRIERAMNS